MRLYVVGDSGCLIRNFGTYDESRVTILDDICATAKGYEYLALMSLNQTLPLFLSGLTAGMAQREPQSRASLPSHEEPEPETDVDWDFLGE